MSDKFFEILVSVFTSPFFIAAFTAVIGFGLGFAFMFGLANEAARLGY